MSYRKKLIEVALPLEEINAASAREKSIRHGHPSTLHLWWARRPLATCRAVLFASIVDDPGEEGVPEALLKAIDALPLAHKYRHLADEEPLDGEGNPLSADVAKQEKAARKRRYRLFTFIERLVLWENSNDAETLRLASELILAATDGNPPPVMDPFCGGGSIPLEAQRLGLVAHASDLNPVAVLVTKAMVEIPLKFAGQRPVNLEARKNDLKTWTGAQGLADDVRFYGKWMRDEAERRIGHLYPKVRITAELAQNRPDLTPYVDQELTVIAWLWARTVPSPDPAASGACVPLVRSFVLGSKKGKEVWIEPVVDAATMTYRFEIRTAETHPDGRPQESTIGRQGGRCILTQAPLTTRYAREQAQAGRMAQTPLAVVAEINRGRVYLPASEDSTPVLSDEQSELVEVERSTSLSGATPEKLTGGTCYGYGLTSWGKLFTDRQLVALLTFSDLVRESRDQIHADSERSGLSGEDLECYTDAVITALSFGISRLADRHSSLTRWDPNPSGFAPKIANTFSRQSLPMVWDFTEGNPFSGSSGNWDDAVDWICKVIERLPASGTATVKQADSRRISHSGVMVSTDPPYFDNIGYADLSDFFYVWLRRSLVDVHPALFATLLTPKSAELIATAHRHEGSRQKGTEFFERGLHEAFARMRENTLPEFPTTIYYAFKQSETEVTKKGGSVTASTGWESMLQGLLDAGFEINGTWPTRTELSNRMIASGTNALASCIVLVCRPREVSAPKATRREFLSALRREIRPALGKLTQGNVAPVDLAQAAIGPGMAVFSRYAAVLESDGKPMRVRTALGLINQVLDETLAEQEGWYDPQTRWAVTWFSQHGFVPGPYGEAETLANAKGAPVGTMVEAGMVRSGLGKVKLIAREELLNDYDPQNDLRVTIWEATQYLARALAEGGELGAARMMRRYRETVPDLDVERCRELAYRLFAICDTKRQAQEARVYNALVLSWSDIESVSQTRDAEWTQITENLFAGQDK